MFKKLFEGEILSLSVVVMVAFMTIFAGMLLWVFVKRRRTDYDAVARLPLEVASGDECEVKS